MKAQLLLVLIALALVASIPEALYRSEFTNWMQKHKKTYGHEEFSARYQTFKNNFDFVANHDSSKGFTVALNKFADLSIEEFSSIYNGLKLNKQYDASKLSTNTQMPVGAPASWDWRNQGVVTGVKNQGQCGSCWSFSATGSTEGAHAIAGKGLVSLSEQNLVDCSTAQGNQGCNGGLMDQAFQYIISNNGIDTEASYPYTATGPNQCQFNPANVGATLSSYQDCPSGDEGSLVSFVYSNPTSVAIDASHSSFQFYSGGVYNEPACSSTQLDHGVLAVGYGTSSSDYWIVKNSWGTDWGLAGYILMSRNNGNNCGIATSASIPKV
eukprot:TRINITY_DN201_c0_g1_i11.p1 TRINITY_DN201_c0_g1~~TRINITY_DN201_c0_g1_i11.p1  ORF type:complete len:325 (+),score=71.79 TRINITY_DN201_c0_g1_i11:69-1043(+)